MNALKFLLLVILLFAGREQVRASDSIAQKHFFHDARQGLEDMLTGKEPASYEQAIFLIENAWWEGGIDRGSFDRSMAYHAGNIERMAKGYYERMDKKPVTDLTGTREEKLQRYRDLAYNTAIYRYLTTHSVWLNDGELIGHGPYGYASSDPMGTADWANTHVSHLINEGEGNCFALASLFKIFSERLHTGAALCTAPSHIYQACG